MGRMAQDAIFAQAKKGQGEMNERLDCLLLLQKETNELLRQLIDLQSH